MLHTYLRMNKGGGGRLWGYAWTVLLAYLAIGMHLFGISFGIITRSVEDVEVVLLGSAEGNLVVIFYAFSQENADGLSA